MNNNADVLKEYYKDDKNVMDTVNRLVFMKLSEMRRLESAKKSRVCLFADEAIGVEELDEEACEGMTYLELMGILYNSQRSGAYRFKYPGSDVHMTSYENYLFYADALSQFFYDACDRSTVIRKFMLIPAKRMLEMLGSENLWRHILDEYKALKKTENVDPHEANALTVKDILDACRDIAFKAWHPACSHPSDYIKSIKNAHALEADLLIRSFLMQYPSVFNMDEIRERYGRKTDIDDNWEDVPEMWDELIDDIFEHPAD